MHLLHSVSFYRRPNSRQKTKAGHSITIFGLKEHINIFSFLQVFSVIQHGLYFKMIKNNLHITQILQDIVTYQLNML